MWDRDRFEEHNERKIRFLSSIAATQTNLLANAADKLSSLATPHIACCFQLPYPISLEPGWCSVGLSEPGLIAQISIRRIVVTLDERGRMSCSSPASTPELSDTPGTFDASQLLVVIPLWGRRLQFYERYRSSYSGQNPSDATVVPLALSWIDGPARSMNATDYEFSLYRRIQREMRFLLGRLLPAYSVCSLCEAPMPASLSAFFLIPTGGHISYNALPEPVLRYIGGLRPALPPNPVSLNDIQAALAHPDRVISRFEQQLFAMNRLCADGEPALALVGTLSLCEWFVAAKFPPLLGGGRQSSLSFILRSTDTLEFVPIDIRSSLLKAISVRNRLVHGAPPKREPLTDGSMKDAGREQRALTEGIAPTDAELAINAAFALYRVVNRSRGHTNR